MIIGPLYTIVQYENPIEREYLSNISKETHIELYTYLQKSSFIIDKSEAASLIIDYQVLHASCGLISVKTHHFPVCHFNDHL